MQGIVYTLMIFSFWGIVFLLSLIFGFQVSFSDIIYETLYGSRYLNLFCSYMTLSIPTFVISFSIHMHTLRKSRLSFGDIISIVAPPLFWTPYKGIDIRGLFTLKKQGLDSKFVMRDILVYIRRLFDTVVWWSVVVFGGWCVKSIPSNRILVSIQSFSKNQILLRLSIVIGIIIALNIFARLYFLYMAKLAQKDRESVRDSSGKGTRSQQYYSRHPERMPSGCAACGGPYPECKASCPLFEE